MIRLTLVELMNDAVGELQFDNIVVETSKPTMLQQRQDKVFWNSSKNLHLLETS